MKRWQGVLAALLVLGSGAGARAQMTVSERLVQLSEVLGKGTNVDSATRIKAIEEIGGMGTTSSLASGLLFDRANVRFEADPLVREAAALNLRHVVDNRNRMAALRLARISRIAEEPDPRVRIAALKTLASFDNADAAARVNEATTLAQEPDPEVREAAKALIAKGLAARTY
jgi:hypothetical protein